MSDWRLPDIDELASLADNRRTTYPFIDVDAFPNTPSTSFWTSSSAVPSGELAWELNFGSGYTNAHDKWDSDHVRCVRDH